MVTQRLQQAETVSVLLTADFSVPAAWLVA